MRRLLITLLLVFSLSLAAQESKLSFEQVENLYQNGQYIKVTDILSQMASANELSIQEEMLMADAHHKQDHFKLAEVGYTKVLKQDKENYIAFFNRGAARVFLEDYKGALKDLKKAIEIYPDSAEMYYYKGYCEAELFDYKDAIESYSKAIALKPNFAEAFYNRGAAKGELDLYEAGMEDFTTALDKEPNLEDGALNVALSKLGMGDLDGAIAGFDQVIAKRDKNLGKAYFYRGEARYDKGLRTEACDDFNRAMTLQYEPADKNIGDLCGASRKSKRREIDITF